MFNYIEQLRKKPERIKKQIAFFVAFLIVGIIFVIWLSVIYPQVMGSKKQVAEVSTITEPRPISAFGDTFFAGLSAISEQFSKIKEAISSFSTLPVYYSATSTTTTIINQ